jgi:hypothetical protein
VTPKTKEMKIGKYIITTRKEIEEASREAYHCGISMGIWQERTKFNQFLATMPHLSIMFRKREDLDPRIQRALDDIIKEQNF